MANKYRYALSVRQPWAWLIVNGYKNVENRNWPTNCRGWFGVHASKTFDRDGYWWVLSEFPQIEMPASNSFALGGIVGRARITDCVEDLDSPWFSGRYGFVLAEPEPLPFLACHGRLGFFRPFSAGKETNV